MKKNTNCSTRLEGKGKVIVSGLATPVIACPDFQGFLGWMAAAVLDL